MKNILVIISAVFSSSIAAFVPPTRQGIVYHPSSKLYDVYVNEIIDDGDYEVNSSQHSNILDFVSYRRVEAEDIPACYKIESASYPEDEAASIQNLYYRQQTAGDYFWCATLPSDMISIFNNNEAIEDEIIIGFICSTRCKEFTEESMSKHETNGSILAIHSVVVDAPYRRQKIASTMMQQYLQQMIPYSTFDANTRDLGFDRMLLLAKSHLLGFYVDNGFMVLRPSPIVHGKETWYELEARKYHLERMIRIQAINMNTDVSSFPQQSAKETRAFGKSRSTSNPDEGQEVNEFVAGRDKRREKLHTELAKLGLDIDELITHPDRFGTAAIRTYNSFLLPKSVGALAVAESPTRPRVVANNISFLVREYKADREKWLRNVDKNRNAENEDGVKSGKTSRKQKHPITIVLDNVRSAANVVSRDQLSLMLLVHLDNINFTYLFSYRAIFFDWQKQLKLNQLACVE